MIKKDRKHQVKSIKSAKYGEDAQGMGEEGLILKMVKELEKSK